MSLRNLVLLPLALLVACGGDADGDGLTNKEEKELGLDKKVADTDGDGLSDGDELANGADPLVGDSDGDGLLDGEEVLDYGSDPTLVDTDEDTYNDFDEVAEGHDPADKSNRIYKGYWPYNPDKGSLGDSSFEGMPLMVGDQFPHYTTGKDQFREKVDVYDFAGRGFIIVDASATWCGPCMNTSAWLVEGADNDVYDYEPTYGPVRKAVNRGDVTWITFMTSNDLGFGSEVDDVVAWDEAFPHEKIPVITDVDAEVMAAVNTDGDYIFWPAFLVLDKNMKVVYRGGGEDSLAFVLDKL